MIGKLFLLLTLTTTMVICLTQTQNAVLDGNFEKFCSSDNPTAIAGDYVGNLVAVHASIYQVHAHSGGCVSDFTDNTLSIIDIEQDVTTTAGATYNVAFSVYNLDDLNPADIDLDFVTTTNSVIGGGGWTSVQAVAVATGATTTLTITLNAGSTVVLIDDIEVVCVANCPSAFSDPHFIGLNGERFDFDGEAGSVYNLLTDDDVQVNTLLGQFKGSPTMYIKGAVMSKIGIRLGEHTVMVSAGGYEMDEIGSAWFNGKEMKDGDEFNIEASEQSHSIYVAFERKVGTAEMYGIGSRDHAVAHVSIIYGDKYSFEIVLIESGQNQSGKWIVDYPRRSLDFTAHPLSRSLHPHGIFGQTAHESNKRNSGSSVEGTKDDYKIQDGNIFGTMFTFNKFQE